MPSEASEELAPREGSAEAPLPHDSAAARSGASHASHVHFQDEGSLDQEDVQVENLEAGDSFDSTSVGNLTTRGLSKGVSKSTLAGASMLAGISFHSIAEAVAIGSMSNRVAFLLIMVSVLAHKVFEVPAIFSPMVEELSPNKWWLGVNLYSMVTPIGLLMGAALASSMHSVGVAAIQCFAGGTLLSVAIRDLIVPSFASGSFRWQLTKCFIAFLSCSFMLLLPTLVR
eukprot:TRINITY_DN1197_c1_g1_i1.p1 TRINITY_DN1197_c1_g1~~TRINITY_DN1197_c1_g1_i1.p1  ORF type:complete len:228 (+),score=36.60 TRINITY_DN1197_c1_g1_i1:161-844(+)